MNIVQTPAPNTIKSGDVRLIKNDFDAQVWGKGYDIYLDKMGKCPCKSEGSNSPLSSCNNCNGTGWFIVERRKTKALISSMNRATQYKEWSEQDMGTAQISLMHEDNASFMDRVMIQNSTYYMKQTLYPKQVLSDASELVWFAFTVYEIKKVDFIFLYLGQIVSHKKLTITEDFTISGNKILLTEALIASLPQDLIDKGLSISVIYTTLVQYHILDVNRDEIESPTQNTLKDKFMGQFPLYYVGRRSHYVLDALNFEGNNVIDNT